ncbi:hypothetical protein AB7645_43070 [Bradyrhizobium sp. 956_D2_N1_5]|uniref:hypothetical protein n=1 Tax=unclassified Bradyrhizobium TaxID=2631580 RepID=UPI003394AE0D
MKQTYATKSGILPVDPKWTSSPTPRRNRASFLDLSAIGRTKPGKSFILPSGTFVECADMKNPLDEKPTGKGSKLSRADQAREVAEEYADDLRRIIRKLRKMLPRSQNQDSPN